MRWEALTGSRVSVVIIREPWLDDVGIGISRWKLLWLVLTRRKMIYL